MSFAIVILEVNDMNYDDRPGISGFMQNTSSGGYNGSLDRDRRRQSSDSRGRSSTGRSHPRSKQARIDAERARQNSVGGNPIRSHRSRRTIEEPSLRDRISDFIAEAREHLQMIGFSVLLGSTITLGAQAVVEPISTEINFGDNPIVKAVDDELNSHKSITSDNEGWQLDQFGASQGVGDILDHGADPLTVFGAAANNLNEDYAKDELDYITEQNFGMDSDSLVRSLDSERYADGVRDEDFQNDFRAYAANQTTHQEGLEMSQMLSELRENQNADQKGYGGK